MIEERSCVTEACASCSEVRQSDEPLSIPTLPLSKSHNAIDSHSSNISVSEKRLRSVRADKVGLSKSNNAKEVVSVEEKIFGYELVLDLYGCDKEIITSRKKLKEYVDKLCKLIKMKKFGKTLLPYFGQKAAHTKGYSLVQLIETSSITGHFSDYWQTAYINIFSCKKYDRQKAEDFTRTFFKAKRVKTNFLIR